MTAADAIEHALDQVDRGAFARRGRVGEPVPSRVAVSGVERRLRMSRVELTMWTLHGRCGPGHSYEAHRWMAGMVVDALFPRGAMS